MKAKTLAVLCLCFLTPMAGTLLRADAAAVMPRTQETAAQEPAQKGKFGFVIIPVVFYMPETKIGGGVGGLITYRAAKSDPADRPSSLYFHVVYTQLKQFSTQWEPELYFKKELYLLKSKMYLEKFPDKFWGLGNNTADIAEENYTPRTFFSDTSFQRRVWAEQNLYLGVQYTFETYKILEVTREDNYEGKSLEQGYYLGDKRATTSGLGFIVNWDTRDNLFFPTRGKYWQVSAYFNRKFLGSDYDFNTFKLDARNYFSPWGATVLATQVLFQSATGDVPFRSYPKLGGDLIMRGYYLGRYRDKYLLAFQTEFRVPVWWRFGLVGFAGLGEVADKLSGCRVCQLKYSVGFGIRFKIAPKEGTNLRLDFAWGEGSSGFYFTAREAF